MKNKSNKSKSNKSGKDNFNIKNKIILIIILLVSFIILNLDIILVYINKTLKPYIESYSNNYTNVCKTKPTIFLKKSSGDSIIDLDNYKKTYSLAPNSCKYNCDLCNCDIYLVDNSNCYTYNFNNDSNIASNIVVSCDNRINKNNNPNYLGIGYINTNYYKSNKSDFTYKDNLITKANDIKKSYNNIKQEISRIKGTSDNRNRLNTLYNEFNNKIKNLASYLDLSKNTIFSTMVENDYSVSSNDTNYTNKLYNIGKLYDKVDTLDSKIDDDSLEFDRKYLIYMILLIIMIITILLLALYKFAPNSISDSKLMIFYVAIIALVYFIHTYAKV